MELKSLLVDSKTAWVEFPGMEGFEVELANLSRKELVNLRKKCTTNKFDRKTRAFNEELDESKFLSEFTKAVVKNWKGLKLKYLEDILLVDLSGQDPEKEMDYSYDNAKVLVENSSEFDNWLNEVVFDLENFRTKQSGTPVKKAKAIYSAALERERATKKKLYGKSKYSFSGKKEGLGDKISKISKKYAKSQKKSKKALKNKKGPYQENVFFESTTKDGMTETHIYWESDGKPHGYTFNFVNELNEAEYQGRKVKLGKIMQGDTKKFKVYVKNPKGNVVKVNFGQGGDAKGGTMRIRKSNPKARKSFRARHNCDNPGPRHKARYWSCKKW